MRLYSSILPSALLLAASAVQAASSWSFDEATVAIGKKGAETTTESFNSKSPLKKSISVAEQDTVTIFLTAKDGGKAKRPHQAFLLLRDTVTGVEAPFPLAVKSDGKGKVSITQRDLPIQILASPKPIEAAIVIGSFGAAKPVLAQIFELEFKGDPSVAGPQYVSPERMRSKPEIVHEFRKADKTPPRIISVFFTLIVVASLPGLFVAWLSLGANANHLQKAIGEAPLSHAAFFGSIVGIEAVYFAYHVGYTLFQVLGPLTALAVVAILSGTRALGEVQSRRLAGER